MKLSSSLTDDSLSLGATELTVPAGGTADVLPRILAEKLRTAYPAGVVVENKAGAGGNIGADLVAKAQEDHTIGIIGNGPLTSAKFLYPQLPYDPQKDFAPLALVGAAPLVWVTNKTPTQLSAADFIQQLKTAAKPPAYGSTGLGAGTHLGMEVLREKLGFEAFAGEPAQHWLILKHREGGYVIGLFQGMFERNALTFNPGWDADANPLGDFTDVREIQRALKLAGVPLVVEADEATRGPAHFMALDPDGNPILVDQHV